MMRRKDREVKEIEEIAQILDKCKTICIAMIDHNMPYVVPMSYGYELIDNQLVLYLHCAKQGRKVEILNCNPTVCFTIFSEGEPLISDTPCHSGYYYSSIIGNGQVEFIEEVEEKRKALNKMFAHQSGKNIDFTDKQAETVCLFKIISEDFIGKRKPMK